MTATRQEIRARLDDLADPEVQRKLDTSVPGALALQICEPLLDDPARTVRQAVGWAIREAGKMDEDLILEFLLRHRSSMRPAVLREASRKLSSGEREKLLART